MSAAGRIVEGPSAVRYEGVLEPAFSPDGARVAVGVLPARVLVLDEDGAVCVDHELRGPLRALRWTSDDHLLVISFERGRNVARLLELPDGGPVAEVVLFQGESFDLDVSADRRLLWVSPHRRGNRLANRYAAWLELPSLVQRTSVDVLEIACRAAGFAPERAGMLDHCALDPQGQRVAIPVRFQPGYADAKAHVVVVHLGGQGTVPGRQCVAATEAWKDPVSVHWIGRDTFLAAPTPDTYPGNLWRVAVDERSGSTAGETLGKRVEPSVVGSYADHDPDGRWALVRWGFNGGPVQRVDADGAQVQAPVPWGERWVRLDRRDPDVAYALGYDRGKVALRRWSLRDLADPGKVVWSDTGEAVEGMSVLPNDRGLLLKLRRRGVAAWLALRSDLLRAR